jgi:hypothetical protein
LSVEQFPVGTKAGDVVLKVLKPLAVVGTFDGMKDSGSVAVEGLAGGVRKGSLSSDGP